MQHVVAAGHASQLVETGLGEVISGVMAGELTVDDTVEKLGQLQSAAGFASSIVDASAGKLTNKGKDTLGIGGSWVAQQVNRRALTDQRRENELNGTSDTSGGDPTASSVFTDLTNIMARPERYGVREDSALRVNPGKTGKSKKGTTARTKAPRGETERQKVSTVVTLPTSR